MASWWSRVFGASESPRAYFAPREAPARVAATTAAADAAPPTDAIVGCRRPLLDREGRLAGFEFLLAGPMAQRLRRSGDATAHVAHAAALLGSMQATRTSGRAALLALPLAIAARPAVLSQVAAGTMLALTDGPWSDPAATAALAALRKAGARLGGVGAPIEQGQFLLLDGHSLDSAALTAAAQAARRGRPGLQVVATALQSIEALEAALEHGIDLAAGNVDRTTSTRPSGTLPPRQQRVCQLLNHLLRDDELTALAAELRTDVDLSYQLLVHANSPLLGLSRPADSAEQAMMLLGRDGIYRWLTLQLLTGTSGRRSSRALQEVALARARLLEALAPHLAAPPTALFTLGMLSLLEVMLHLPMAEALRPLQLPAPATAALVDGNGPWYPALELAKALERNEIEAADALATPFGGLDAVNAEAAAAWRWAADTLASAV
jgi:EAL and modified HD-GYP domain-containing signal transduction protein